TRHGLLGAELLRRVRQRRRNDDGRRHAHVLVPDTQAGECAAAKVRIRPPRHAEALRRGPLPISRASLAPARPPARAPTAPTVVMKKRSPGKFIDQDSESESGIIRSAMRWRCG
ncbi:hypothetical protein THAOC_21213, partial [Thalassiosira oceanica]